MHALEVRRRTRERREKQRERRERREIVDSREVPRSFRRKEPPGALRSDMQANMQHTRNQQEWYQEMCQGDKIKEE